MNQYILLHPSLKLATSWRSEDYYVVRLNLVSRSHTVEKGGKLAIQFHEKGSELTSLSSKESVLGKEIAKNLKNNRM